MSKYRRTADQHFAGHLGDYIVNKSGNRALFWPFSQENEDITKTQLEKLFERGYEGTLLGRFPSGDIVGVSDDGGMFSILHDCGEMCPGKLSFEEFMIRVFLDEGLEDDFYLEE